MALKIAFLGIAGLDTDGDVGYRLYSGNTPEAARVTDGIIDLGDGWYQAEDAPDLESGQHLRWDSLSEPEATAREFYQSAGTVELDPAVAADIATIKTKVLPLGTATVRMTSPLNTTGDELEIVRGDDLYYADGKILEWENSSWNIPENSTVLLTVKSGAGVLFAVAGVRVSATKVRVPAITREDTTKLPESSSVLPRFEVKITQSDGHVYRKVLGNIRVVQNVSAN